MVCQRNVVNYSSYSDRVYITVLNWDNSVQNWDSLIVLVQNWDSSYVVSVQNWDSLIVLVQNWDSSYCLSPELSQLSPELSQLSWRPVSVQNWVISVQNWDKFPTQVQHGQTLIPLLRLRKRLCVRMLYSQRLEEQILQETELFNSQNTCNRKTE